MPSAMPDDEFEPVVTPDSVVVVALSRDDPTLGSLFGFCRDEQGCG
jgi:hypothetical protein